jgi:hypothetical protein
MIGRRVCKVDRARGVANFAAGMIVSAILSCGLGFAAQGSGHNGSYWSGLPQPARITYVEGYTDAMQTSIKKLQSLEVAADLLHWKGSKKILAQVARELNISGRSAEDLMHCVDKIYSDAKYRELELGTAMQLAATRGDPSSASDSLVGGAK